MPGRERFSENVGIWTTMAGQPNEVCHMWAYDSLDRRAEVRAAVPRLDDGAHRFLDRRPDLVGIPR